MAGFGGAVKLTGESEYRQAIQNITRDLSQMSSALRTQASEFSASDKGLRQSATAQKELNDAIEKQQQIINAAKNALAQYSVALQAQQTRHNALTKEYRDAVKELDRIEQESGEASDAYQKQAEVVDRLGQELAESTKEMNDSKGAMANLKKTINDAEKAADSATKDVDELGDATEEAGKDANKAGDGYTVFKGILANLGSQAITAAISGLKKLGSSIVGVGKQAYYSYASYEQLVGGIETLFGESAGIVQEYAANAYKTAGLSANEYMEQVTSFSATLLQGLEGDTATAAEYANMAMIDMSDNANKMGTSMQSIQNAYQGFAKDNFTMLDNLKLGYGGTASEMARLINDSGVLGEAITVTAQTVKDVPFDKMIEAIHKTQQEIGITGTTAQEAAGTIEGSTKAVQASWQNLLVAVADENGDLKGSLNTFIDNVMMMAENAVPRILQIVEGLWEAIKTALYRFAPEVAEAIVPTLEGIGEVIKNVFNWIVDNVDTIIKAIEIIGATFIAVKIGQTIKGWIDGISGFITGLENALGLMSGGWIVALALAVGGIVAVMAAFSEEESKLTDADEELIKAVDETAGKVDELAENWGKLKEKRDDYLKDGLSETKHLEDLAKELDGLVYQTGRVKEGYEGRVQFILGELNEALGKEYKMNNGIVQSYKDIQDEIDKLIEKQKAKIKLDAQKSLYEEAVRKEEEAVDALTEAEKEQTDARDAVEEGEKRIIELKKQREEAERNSTSLLTQGVDARVDAIQKEIDQEMEAQKTREEALKNAEQAYKEADDTLKEYFFNIATYEENEALFLQGRYDEMTTATYEYTKTYGEASEARIKQTEDELEREKKTLGLLRDAQAQSGADIYDSQVKAHEDRIALLESQLKSYAETTQEELIPTKLAWGENTQEIIKLLKEAGVTFHHQGKDHVQMLVNGVEEGEPIAVDEAAELMQKMIDKISEQQYGTVEYGRHFVDGLVSGIHDEQGEVFAAIAGLAGQMRRTLMKELQIQSPSRVTRQIGEYFMQGLDVGMKDEEKATLKQITDTSGKMVDAMRTGLRDSVRIDGVGAGYSGRGRTDAVRYDEGSGLVDAFMAALSQMKIELDDEVAGKFVERTVTRVVYA